MHQAEEGSDTINVEADVIEEIPQEEESQVIEEESEAPGEKGLSDKEKARLKADPALPFEEGEEQEKKVKEKLEDAGFKKDEK